MQIELIVVVVVSSETREYTRKPNAVQGHSTPAPLPSLDQTTAGKKTLADRFLLLYGYSSQKTLMA